MASRQGLRPLLITFDAFATLYRPKESITAQYLKIAERFGIDKIDQEAFGVEFKKAFKKESKDNPNYGKETGSTPEKWWTNIIINTFTPFLPPTQTLPDRLAPDLIKHFSTKDAYTLYDDVLPLFRGLKQLQASGPSKWPYSKTIVGIISNSDDRVSTVLESLGVNIRLDGQESLQKSSTSSSSIHTDDGDYMIDFVTLSYTTSVEKPSPEIFYAAFTTAKELVKDMAVDGKEWRRVHVGDHVEKDAYGAARCGWEGLYLCRNEDQQDWGSSGLPGGSQSAEENSVERISSLLDVLGYVSLGKQRDRTVYGAYARKLLSK